MPSLLRAALVRLVAVSLFISMSTLSVLPARAQPAPAAPKAGALKFVTYQMTDSNFQNMRIGTLSIPVGWQAQTQVKWDFTSANYPVHIYTHIQSPDGKMWVNLLPSDAIYWLDRVFRQIPVGQRYAGAVYAPNANIDQAMTQLLVLPWRGKMPGFQITDKHAIDAAQLVRAFGVPEARGDAMTMHVRYTLNGTAAEEDFFSLYTAVQAIPFTGPQGTTHEYHRQIVLAHSIGATDGLLPSVRPLLGIMVSSMRMDEAYQRHIQSVKRTITAQFQAEMKKGFDSIAAAGELSRRLTAQSDAFIASVEQQRAAQNRADASRRAANSSASGGVDTNDNFSQLIRGTSRFNDPYWGTSERDNMYSQHWTDGQGNYRASNDVGFDPNVGSTGATWQRMTPVN